jgi:cell division septation protein DedD
VSTGNKRGGGGGKVVAGRHMVGIFALLVVMLGVVFTLGYVLGRSEYDTSIRAAASSIPAVATVKENSAGGAGKNSAAGKTARAPAPDWDFYHAGEPAKPVERVGAAPEPAEPADRADRAERAPAPAEAAAPAEPPARQPLEKQPVVVARAKLGAANARKGPPLAPKGATKGAVKAGGKATSKAAGGAGGTPASRGDKSSYRGGGGRTAGRSSGEAKNGAGAGAPKAAPAKSTGTGGAAIPRGSTVLQVASVVRQADAAALAQALQKKKFPAFVTPPGADHFYRVQVGPYADAQLANAARQKLEEQGFKISVKR